jgi:hypothetical protein
MTIDNHTSECAYSVAQVLGADFDEQNYAEAKRIIRDTLMAVYDDAREQARGIARTIRDTADKDCSDVNVAFRGACSMISRRIAAMTPERQEGEG